MIVHTCVLAFSDSSMSAPRLYRRNDSNEGEGHAEDTKYEHHPIGKGKVKIGYRSHFKY
jgi:hypothetical protein